MDTPEIIKQIINTHPWIWAGFTGLVVGSLITAWFYSKQMDILRERNALLAEQIDRGEAAANDVLIATTDSKTRLDDEGQEPWNPTLRAQEFARRRHEAWQQRENEHKSQAIELVYQKKNGMLRSGAFIDTALTVWSNTASAYQGVSSVAVNISPAKLDYLGQPSSQHSEGFELHVGSNLYILVRACRSPGFSTITARVFDRRWATDAVKYGIQALNVFVAPDGRSLKYAGFMPELILSGQSSTVNVGASIGPPLAKLVEHLIFWAEKRSSEVIPRA